MSQEKWTKTTYIFFITPQDHTVSDGVFQTQVCLSLNPCSSNRLPSDESNLLKV